MKTNWLTISDFSCHPPLGSLEAGLFAGPKGLLPGEASPDLVQRDHKEHKVDAENKKNRSSKGPDEPLFDGKPATAKRKGLRCGMRTYSPVTSVLIQIHEFQ